MSPPEPEGPILDVCSAVGSGPYGRCPEPVAEIVWLGCVNEHVGPCGFCERHIGYINENVTRLVCGTPACRNQVPVMIVKRERVTSASPPGS